MSRTTDDRHDEAKRSVVETPRRAVETPRSVVETPLDPSVEAAVEATQLIIEAAAVDRAALGPCEVMVWATMRTNRVDRPVLRQIFMDREVARKLATDIQLHFGK